MEAWGIRMVKIAVTGSSGSGKGYICSLLERRGISCLDTDLVVHRLYSDPLFTRRLSEIFCCDLSAPDGSVDRKKLAGIVYKNSDAMNELLKTVYPLVRSECACFFKEASANGKNAAVIDAPQLFEANMALDVDVIIAVSAAKNIRLSRILCRDGITAEQAHIRMAHQKSDEEYQKLSHYIIVNNEGSQAEKQLDEILKKIL